MSMLDMGINCEFAWLRIFVQSFSIVDDGTMDLLHQ